MRSHSPDDLLNRADALLRAHSDSASNAEAPSTPPVYEAGVPLQVGPPTGNPAAPPLYDAPTGNPAAPPMYGGPTGNPAVPPMYGGPTGNPAAPPMYGGPTGNPAAPPMYGAPTGNPAAPPVYGAPAGNPGAPPLHSPPPLGFSASRSSTDSLASSLMKETVNSKPQRFECPYTMKRMFMTWARFQDHLRKMVLQEESANAVRADLRAEQDRMKQVGGPTKYEAYGANSVDTEAETSMETDPYRAIDSILLPNTSHCQVLRISEHDLKSGDVKARIARQYRMFASLVHPDKCQDPRAEEAFKALGSAYTTMMTNPNSGGAPWAQRQSSLPYRQTDVGGATRPVHRAAIVREDLSSANSLMYKNQQAGVPALK